jgi:hypothetical protein
MADPQLLSHAQAGTISPTCLDDLMQSQYYSTYETYASGHPTTPFNELNPSPYLGSNQMHLQRTLSSSPDSNPSNEPPQQSIHQATESWQYTHENSLPAPTSSTTGAPNHWSRKLSAISEETYPHGLKESTSSLDRNSHAFQSSSNQSMQNKENSPMAVRELKFDQELRRRLSLEEIERRDHFENHRKRRRVASLSHEYVPAKSNHHTKENQLNLKNATYSNSSDPPISVLHEDLPENIIRKRLSDTFSMFTRPSKCAQRKPHLGATLTLLVAMDLTIGNLHATPNQPKIPCQVALSKTRYVFLYFTQPSLANLIGRSVIDMVHPNDATRLYSIPPSVSMACSQAQNMTSVEVDAATDGAENILHDCIGSLSEMEKPAPGTSVFRGQIHVCDGRGGYYPSDLIGYVGRGTGANLADPSTYPSLYIVLHLFPIQNDISVTSP